MSNIERRYAYHDDGVLPAQGEYGVTYLTLYSSGAGNVYDGWIYDPDGKTTESQTPRTFGYRNPDYPDYCWDDEVTVDLSNAQNRQESSEFEQGRITSFNTNVSDRPIILQDIDVTGMTEDQREARATTILFTAIPLIKDAYIHAEVEVQMKMNISPNNTSGNVRVEAFYILNDESDRTMRPHPINHYTVTKTDEYNILRLLYWNPALHHETQNYIGVKLIVSGGTAEIGISDDPDYGDAIITVSSAGLNGDVIYSGKPESIELFGKQYVPAGYLLKEDDYTVLCTYDTGEVYDVTRLCEYTPSMGSPIVLPVTTLIAEYMGLDATMQIFLAQVESIEIMGVQDIYEPYKLTTDDYVVLAYFDTGDVWDVTEECTFSPAMGTTISQDTDLTATYEPFWMVGQSFTDTLHITKHTLTLHVPSEYGDSGLIYDAYDHGAVVIISGNADISAEYVDGATDMSVPAHQTIRLPNGIISDIIGFQVNEVELRWEAEGTPSGIFLDSSIDDKVKFRNFRNINFTSLYSGASSYSPEIAEYRLNSIIFNIYGDGNNGSRLDQYDLLCLGNVDDHIVVKSRGNDHDDYSEMFSHIPLLTNVDFMSNWNIPAITNMAYMFLGCTHLKNVNGMSGIDTSNVTNMYRMFYECMDLEDVSGMKLLDVSEVTNMKQMFYKCESLESARELSLWNPAKVSNSESMFVRSGLKNIVGIGNWAIGNSLEYSEFVNAKYMFANTKITNLVGLHQEFFNKIIDATGLFGANTELTSLKGAENADVHLVTDMTEMFAGCTSLQDISDIENWQVASATTMNGMFKNIDRRVGVAYLNTWTPTQCNDYHSMFAYDDLTWENYYFSAYGLFDNLSISKDEAFQIGPYHIIGIDTIHVQEKYDPHTDRQYFVTMGCMFSGVDAFYCDGHYDSSLQGWVLDQINYRHEQSLPTWYKNMLDEEIAELYHWGGSPLHPERP